MRKSSISLQDWCLQNGREILLKEWDFEKNDFLPSEIARASAKKAHWICSQCGNDYLMTIQNRTLTGGKCRKCANAEAWKKKRKRKIEEVGSLAETNPELLNKWDYDRNINITPYDVTRYSAIKVWWKCPVCGYEFLSPISQIKTSDRCRRCKGNENVNLGRDGKYTVYCHTCPDGKKYIGCTSMPLKKRFGNGANYSKTFRFGKAIQEFGWENIIHEVLESGLEEKEAHEKEKYYIKLYNTTNEKYGYNMTEGGLINGFIGRQLSKETIEKIANSNRGQKRSEETRRKLRESHLGKDSGHVSPVIKMDLQGNFLKEYKSVADAVRDNDKVDKNSIWRCCTGRRKTAGGFTWKYKK